MPLAPHTRQQLVSAGYTTAADLQHVTPQTLAAVFGTQEEAEEVLLAALGTPEPGWRLSGATSASELLEAGRDRRRLTTSCAELDALLGGGVATGAVMEFCGVPGVGKTQMGMQLAINAQIPPEFGGLGGMAVYIDTEGSFMPDRVVDIASAAVRRVEGLARESRDPNLLAAAERFTIQSALEGILYFRAQDHTQQLALLHTLDVLLSSQPQVALVVIDSVTFHFRQDWPDAGLRSRLLAGMAQDAIALAEGRGLAVVFMNQVTTKVMDESSGGGVLVPALGESWGQASSTRVVLFWEGPQRFAHVLKATHIPEGVLPGRQQQQLGNHKMLAVPFDVQHEGVCSAALPPAALAGPAPQQVYQP